MANKLLAIYYYLYEGLLVITLRPRRTGHNPNIQCGEGEKWSQYYYDLSHSELYN